MTEQRRIILWATPRTLSTSFTRAMVSRKNCKLLNEISFKTFYYGTERTKVAWLEGPDRLDWFLPQKDLPLPNCTYKDLYNELNCPYEGFDEVFAKEQAFRLKPALDRGDLGAVIPDDYVHVFLIRDPTRSVTSFWNLVLNCPTAGDPGCCHCRAVPTTPIPETSWKELKQVYDWVVKEKGYKPLVIDAGDLQREPERVTRRFCEFVKIDYQDSMVNWPPMSDIQKENYKEFGDTFKLAAESKSFLPSTPKTALKDENFASLVQDTIDKAMPIYKMLKEEMADECFC